MWDYSGNPTPFVQDVGSGDFRYTYNPNDPGTPPDGSVLDVWRNDWGCTNSLFPDTQDGSGGHWEEACLGNELMTPTRNGNAPVNPISALSIAALQDMSYEVDISAAEAGSNPDDLTSFPSTPNNCCKNVRRKRKKTGSD